MRSASPAFGESTRQRDRPSAGWADDLPTVANVLGAERFAVTGWSEDEPWMLLTTAHLAPERLRHITAVFRAGRRVVPGRRRWFDEILAVVAADLSR
ncbi:hypothetical protein FDO65_05625 [Nakamurella flava]|uniref:Uncharacterized protein n=1 Tax=Nakamurella flava TaxID=2576308 RepID=A0A4U6QLU0_9ACTN|nr:hypothetical protein [Nakamurella flava]TKV61116.1 hypothetical protein FDO65_05625 [Nakamurella flava]